MKFVDQSSAEIAHALAIHGLEGATKEIEACHAEITRLRAELEDVRQQRSVLVMESEALGRAVQELRAEVDRLGDMLRLARKYLGRIPFHALVDGALANLLEEIESLDNAPLTSNVNAGEDVQRDGG